MAASPLRRSSEARSAEANEGRGTRSREQTASKQTTANAITSFISDCHFCPQPWKLKNADGTPLLAISHRWNLGGYGAVLTDFQKKVSGEQLDVRARDFVESRATAHNS